MIADLALAKLPSMMSLGRAASFVAVDLPNFVELPTVSSARLASGTPLGQIACARLADSENFSTVTSSSHQIH